MANNPQSTAAGVTGEFLDLAGERYYRISHVDQMPPFLLSLVSDSDHWMFIASNGGMTAGRVSPETALFPYITVDNLYDSTLDTGSRTLLWVERDGQRHLWEPFNRQLDRQYQLSRHLYRNYLGDKIRFEEINHDLGLRFSYGWSSSEAFGFVRDSELHNCAEQDLDIELLDGLQNLLPAGTPRYTQTNSSYLVDAYKLSELDTGTGLALFTLYSAISDRAEPKESLRANTAFCLGLENPRILLSSTQLEAFRAGAPVQIETAVRGRRGAYLASTRMSLRAGQSRAWQMVLGLEQGQAACADLQHRLQDPETLAKQLAADVTLGSDSLARIMAAADSAQVTGEETVYSHHYANVLYNVLRGGIPDTQYRIDRVHFVRHLETFNRDVLAQSPELIADLPDEFDVADLLERAAAGGSLQLQRLALEYLPITFGRRHGDPSRPWNQFKIELKDSHGQPLLTYQGNWRDIFQNWEALLLSYPGFAESVIAKFVNASTVDGYNPYRITSTGVDWEIEDPEDPWSYIGYWGDHQIIYLLKLMELSRKYAPRKLEALLHQRLFSYANVPYRIKPFEQLLADPKSTVEFDSEAEKQIEARVGTMGADGKLVLDAEGAVYQVNLVEKLLVSLLAKVSNFVMDGGIWLNTQRPEWNDANNALVGHGLSMVTLYYLRRFLVFLIDLLGQASGSVPLSAEVANWFRASLAALETHASTLGAKPASEQDRYRLLAALGEAASDYRSDVYRDGFTGTSDVANADIQRFLELAVQYVDASIRSNRRSDGLYHAYNLLRAEPDSIQVEHLYPMLEGQVAVMSSGALDPGESIAVLQQLFDSAMFREDQLSFLLYPDRDVPGFLQKNRFAAHDVAGIDLVSAMLDKADYRVIQPDVSGDFRFHPDIVNANALIDVLARLEDAYGELARQAREPLARLYEETFHHHAFTGRSGGMFAFEGLGSIYWHMVSKLLLAAQENYFSALTRYGDVAAARELGQLYYRIREGIGFNKTPQEYGAIPTDPYSHTPAHMGAQQPGMTGQVKEEILTRFGELGLQVEEGGIRFRVSLLREQEFCSGATAFRYLDTTGTWQRLQLPADALGFTFCQVPVVYTLRASAPAVTVSFADGQVSEMGLEIPAEIAEQIFARDGRVARIDVALTRDMLFDA